MELHIPLKRLLPQQLRSVFSGKIVEFWTGL